MPVCAVCVGYTTIGGMRAVGRGDGTDGKRIGLTLGRMSDDEPQSGIE